MTGDLAEAGPPSWGVVLVCVAVACWVATATVLAAVLTAPHRVVRRRPRYRGAHAQGQAPLSEYYAAREAEQDGDADA